MNGQTQPGIRVLTYDELLQEFEQFNSYVRAIIQDGPDSVFLAELDRIYEEPNFSDPAGQEYPTEYLTKWRDKSASDTRWLIIVGDYGTGKTALTQILQYRWLQDYKHDPSCPIPFRIELRHFVRQFDARSLLHHFLDKNHLAHLSINFVLSLIREGRIVLLLDGYDEMAQYLDVRERRACLEALAELAAVALKEF